MVDLQSLSTKELISLRAQVEDLLPKKQEEALRALRQRIAELVAAEGYSLQEVLQPMLQAKKAGGRRRTSRTVKYRHPDNPSLTWSGRGKKPNWLSAWLNEHGTLEGLAA